MKEGALQAGSVDNGIQICGCSAVSGYSVHSYIIGHSVHLGGMERGALAGNAPEHIQTEEEQ
jgi:hypothetical protein